MERRTFLLSGGLVGVTLAGIATGSEDRSTRTRSERDEDVLAVVDYYIQGGDPDEEYITLRNIDDSTHDASEWRLRDRWEGGRVDADMLAPLAFPTGFTWEPSAEVTVVSGEGTDTDETLYWGSPWQIWNEDGDVVIVLDGDDEVLLEEPIPPGSVTA